MDRLELMRTFVAVATTGSFTAAADRLSMTPQLTSKYVRALEDHLEVTLLTRTTRRVSLTETGNVFLERCKALLDSYEELAASVRQDGAKPKGHLKVSAPVTFGELYLVDALLAFTGEFPELEVTLDLTDRYIDIVEDGVDVAIRIGTLGDSSLIARSLAPAQFLYCANANYLARHGRPVKPADLLDHSCIVDTNFRDKDQWPFMVDGTVERIRVSGKFRVNSASVARRLTLAGEGILMGPSYVVSADIQEGRLEPLLQDYQLPQTRISAVYPEKRHLSAKTRVFVDFMTDHLKQIPALAV